MPDEFEKRQFFLPLSDAIKLEDSLSTSSKSGVQLSDSITLRDSLSASPPLVQMVGTAIYLTPPGSPPVVISPKPGSALPDAGLNENMWDLTTTGVGVTIGAVIGHVPGAVVGGAFLYGWGRIRRAQVQKNKHQGPSD